MDKETSDTNKQAISDRLFQRNSLEHSYITHTQQLHKDISRCAIIEKKNNNRDAKYNNNNDDNYSNNYYNKNYNNSYTSKSIIEQIINNTSKITSSLKPVTKLEPDSSDVFNERLSRFTPIAKTNSYPFVDNVLYVKNPI